MRFLHEKTCNLETHSNVQLEVQTVSDNPSGSSPLQSQGPIQSPSSCSSTSEDVKCSKRKRSDTDEKNDIFLDHVKRMDEKMINYLDDMKGKENQEKDEAQLFCTSLIPVFRDMNKKQLRLAKLKVQQLLYDLQYADN